MPTVRLVKCPQSFTDHLGRPMIITTHRNTSKRYPSHGAKRGGKPIKDDAPDLSTPEWTGKFAQVEAVKVTGV